MKDKDNEAGPTKDSEAGPSTETLYKKPKCRKYITKYLSFGFTSIDFDG
jgi:hypothetical protein